jgi:hypothetical protein
VDPHVQTVFICFHQFRLIWGPGEVFCHGNKVGAGAPTPASPTLLKPSCPVVEVCSPVCFNFILMRKIFPFTKFTFGVVAEASLLLLRSENDWIHAKAAAFLNILLPGHLTVPLLLVCYALPVKNVSYKFISK